MILNGFTSQKENAVLSVFFCPIVILICVMGKDYSNSNKDMVVVVELTGLGGGGL